MIELTDHDEASIKLRSCEKLAINESEIYNIYFSEILIDKHEIVDVIKLLQDYDNAK